MLIGINSSADAWLKGNTPELNPGGSGYSPAHAGLFSLRRARYFNETGFEEIVGGMRHAGSAEASVTCSSAGFEQAESSPTVGRGERL